MAVHSLWYKDSILYSLHFRSFFDTTGNGIGDINGVIQKLDYLEDLGVNCLIIHPFYASPLKDDGYDISNYCQIHPDYGTLEEFKQLLNNAHKRGIRIVIDLVLNHTSTEHPWFQRARKAPAGSPERNFYVWSDDPNKYEEAELIFHDYESSNWEWDNVAKAYYWHRFYRHQPDLNYDNPAVQEEIKKVVDYWFTVGVDGLQLISVAYLYERENTNGVNLPEVHDFLKQLRTHVDSKHTDKLLMADTNLWPEEAGQYFGDGDECHMNYHYPLMPRLFMAVQAEDTYPVVDILEETPAIAETCQWALFLRNHDDLILSTVTDEERVFLYNSFAPENSAKVHTGIRRRLAPLLGNDRRKIELLNSLLFSLPGSPMIYYGDEIGMGDNIYLGDRNGIRTPMQWNAERNAGFSTANTQQLFLPVIQHQQYRYESVNVDLQMQNSSSLLWWMRNLIATRKQLKALSHGNIRFLDTSNSKVLAFLRSYEGEQVLVIANLSKQAQAISLHLSEFKGIQPIEIFSQNKFFEITDSPYQFVLGAYGYYWFALEQAEQTTQTHQERQLPELETEVAWESFFDNYTTRRNFSRTILPDYLYARRWFGGKSKKIASIDLPRYPHLTINELEIGSKKIYCLNIELRYTNGLPETYFLPTAFITNSEEIENYIQHEPNSVICRLKTPTQQGLVIDGVFIESFRNELFHNMKTNATVSVPGGSLQFESGKVLDALDLRKEDISSVVLNVEQSNTSIIYNGDFFFKMYRKLDTDVNPDLELVRFLSERTGFKNAPAYGGGVQFNNSSDQSFINLGLLQNKIKNQGDAWAMTLSILKEYYKRVLQTVDRSQPLPTLIHSDAFYFDDMPELLQQLIGRTTYDRITLLGERTAEMHIALASTTDDPDFAPERFTQSYQRSIYSQYRKLVADKLNGLEKRMPYLPEDAAKEAQAILDLQEDILACLKEIYSRKIQATKTRIHGDYHLGQVLFDGQDFYIIDFEGEPMHSISERRLKKTPFKDVAGMVRSFHYAAYGQLMLHADEYRAEDTPFLQRWAEQWFHYIRQFYLTAYFNTVAGQSFVPTDEASKKLLLRNYTLEKAIYELGYEMNSRPAWLPIPIRGVLYAMEEYLQEKQG